MCFPATTSVSVDVANLQQHMLQMAQSVEKLQQQMVEASRMTDKLQQRMTTVPGESTLPPGIELPLTTIEDVQETERLLQDATVHAQLVRQTQTVVLLYLHMYILKVIRKIHKHTDAYDAHTHTRTHTHTHTHTKRFSNYVSK